MTDHAHDWGTLIYGECAHCPLTVGDEMERLQRARDLVANHSEGCGCEPKNGFCEFFGITTIREIERVLS